jgi:hypothetical protein
MVPWYQLATELAKLATKGMVHVYQNLLEYVLE